MLTIATVVFTCHTIEQKQNFNKKSYCYQVHYLPSQAWIVPSQRPPSPSAKQEGPSLCIT